CASQAARRFPKRIRIEFSLKERIPFGAAPLSSITRFCRARQFIYIKTAFHAVTHGLIQKFLISSLVVFVEHIHDLSVGDSLVDRESSVGIEPGKGPWHEHILCGFHGTFSPKLR